MSSPLDPVALDPVALALVHYGLRVSAEALPGEHDRNFRLRADDGQSFVLKVSPPTQAPAQLDLQRAVLERFAEANLPVATPRLVRAASGTAVVRIADQRGDTRLLQLLGWVAGAPLRQLRDRPRDLLASWGRLAAELRVALRGFDHPAAHRHSVWDPRHACDARQHLGLVDDPARRDLAARVLARLESARIADRDLPRSVCHADAHEDNLLFGRGADHRPRLVGLVDVGDAVHTYTICELAIACAYAAMDQPDPLGAVATLVRGYAAVSRPSRAEIALLLPLVLARLLTTVTQSALARRDDPANVYRSVSEEQAWALLGVLEAVPAVLAEAHLRAAAGYAPWREAARLRAWLATAPACAPVLALGGRQLGPIDCSVGSTQLGNYADYTEAPRFTRAITRLLEDSGLDVGFGGYLETRPFYTTDLFERPGNDGPRWRTVHLGLDLWSPAGETVFAPLAGRVHSFRHNAGPRDYGATIVLAHEVTGADGQPLHLYTLYGHLSAASLTDLAVGQDIGRGAAFAKTGHPHENGGWPPHLHFQVMLDTLGLEGDFPGVAFPDETAVWAALCPDPAPLAGLGTRSGPRVDPEAEVGRLVRARHDRLGRSLSVSYARPLHIVRGQGAYLLDATGRRYLDTVNNVAHVGHEHPHVVRAIQRQVALLNTNTRYLHTELPALAEELAATLPPELAVVHVVNSGSEANELALRMARAATGRRDVIAVGGGYHGNTSATIGVSGYKFDGPGGGGAPPTTHLVPLPDSYRGPHRDPATAGGTYAAHVDEVIVRLLSRGRAPAAFLCESIPSCGGQVVLPEGYLRAAYAKTRAAGGLCIADEVQTGVGRVGTHWWAFELQGVVPDIVTIGKPIGNGHPLGVVVSTVAVAEAFANGMEYFNTFGGNPVSCAAGRAVLQVVREEGLRERAKQVGAQLLSELRALQARDERIGDVRGHGLFLGVEFVRDATSRAPDAALARWLVERGRERGILMSTDGPHHNVIKIKPPLCFGAREVEQLLHEVARGLGR